MMKHDYRLSGLLLFFIQFIILYLAIITTQLCPNSITHVSQSLPRRWATCQLVTDLLRTC